MIPTASRSPTHCCPRSRRRLRGRRLMCPAAQIEALPRPEEPIAACTRLPGRVTSIALRDPAGDRPGGTAASALGSRTRPRSPSSPSARGRYSSKPPARRRTSRSSPPSASRCYRAARHRLPPTAVEARGAEGAGQIRCRTVARFSEKSHDARYLAAGWATHSAHASRLRRAPGRMHLACVSFG